MGARIPSKVSLVGESVDALAWDGDRDIDLMLAFYKREIETAADPAAQRAKRVEEFREKFANPYVAASRGFVDEVIRPRQTRAKLISALARLETKRDKNPPKKHGNIPL